MSDNELNSKQVEFLFEAYKLRAQLYSEHTGRMWSRFNYLLTGNVALFGFFFSVFLDDKSLTGIILFPLVGMIISIIWFVLGAQDRYYFEGLRKQTQHVERIIANELGMTQLDDAVLGHIKGLRFDVLTWRLSPLSLSRLPAVVPLVLLFLWVLVFFVI